MIRTINVYQEDIDYGNHSSCHACMLGSAINRNLKPLYWALVVSLANLETRNGQGWEDSVSDKKGNTHVQVEIYNYGNTWNAGTADPEKALHTVKLPKIAAFTADNWEHKNDNTFRKHKFSPVMPFSFELDIPEEYLAVMCDDI